MKIQFEGKTVDATELDFEIGREDWAEYKLLDGGIIRVKLTVARIFRLEGDPVRYATQSNVVVIFRGGV